MHEQILSGLSDALARSEEPAAIYYQQVLSNWKRYLSRTKDKRILEFQAFHRSLDIPGLRVKERFGLQRMNESHKEANYILVTLRFVFASFTVRISHVCIFSNE